LDKMVLEVFWSFMVLPFCDCVGQMLSGRGIVQCWKCWVGCYAWVFPRLSLMGDPTGGLQNLHFMGVYIKYIYHITLLVG